jgi:hypothetical protein
VRDTYLSNNIREELQPLDVEPRPDGGVPRRLYTGLNPDRDVDELLVAFQHEVVLPEAPHVISEGRGLECVQQRVANTQVEEEDLPRLGDLLAQVAAEADGRRASSRAFS